MSMPGKDRPTIDPLRRAPREAAYIPGENRAIEGLGRVNVALARAVMTKNRTSRGRFEEGARVPGGDAAGAVSVALGYAHGVRG